MRIQGRNKRGTRVHEPVRGRKGRREGETVNWGSSNAELSRTNTYVKGEGRVTGQPQGTNEHN